MRHILQEYHKEFVQSSIDNATQMITLIDAKVGVLFALYSLIFVGIIEVRENIKNALVLSYETCKNLFVILLVMTIGCFLLFSISAIFALNTVMPTINPNKNVQHRQFTDKQMWYIMTSKDKTHLEYSLDDYCRKLSRKSNNFCIKCLSYELLKLSYIRNKKNNNFKTSLKFFSYFLIGIGVTAIPIIFINMF